MDREETTVQLRSYAMFLVKKGLKVKTVIQYLSIVKSEGQSRNPTWLSSPYQLREYSEIGRGLKRLFGAEDALVLQPKHPVQPEELLLLMRTAKSSTTLPKELRVVVAAVMCILFGGMMRAADLMGDMATRPTLTNIAFAPSGEEATLRLPKRKTSSYDDSLESEVHLFSAMPGDPVHHLRMLVNDAKIEGRQQLAPATLNTGVKSFWAILKRLSDEAGLQSKITPHCFRHGGATFLLKNNVNTAVIKRLGGWKSEQAFYKYLHSDSSSDAMLLREAVNMS